MSAFDNYCYSEEGQAVDNHFDDFRRNLRMKIKTEAAIDQQTDAETKTMNQGGPDEPRIEDRNE